MKKVCSAQNLVEAHLMRNHLAANGIDAVVHGELLDSAKGGLPVGCETDPTVWVVDDGDLERARELIAAVASTRNPNPTHCEQCGYDLTGLPEPRCPECGRAFYRPSFWECPECGEQIEDQFTSCWRCAEPESDSAQYSKACLSDCPRCGYDLTGLPAIHTCPECGLKYDPHMKAFELITPAGRYRALNNVMTACMVAAFIITRVMSLPSTYVLLTILLGMVVVRCYSLSRRATESWWLIVGKDGVRLEESASDSRTIAWSDLGDVRYAWMSGKLYFDGNDGRPQLTVEYERLGSGRAARRCANEIRELARVYSS